MTLNAYKEIQRRLAILSKQDHGSCQNEDENDVGLCNRPTMQRGSPANILQLRRLTTMMGKRSAVRNASVRLLRDVMKDLIRSHKWQTPLPAVTVRDEPSELHRLSSLYGWLRGLENNNIIEKVCTPSDCYMRKPLTAVTGFLIFDWRCSQQKNDPHTHVQTETLLATWQAEMIPRMAQLKKARSLVLEYRMNRSAREEAQRTQIIDRLMFPSFPLDLLLPVIRAVAERHACYWSATGSNTLDVRTERIFPSTDSVAQTGPSLLQHLAEEYLLKLSIIKTHAFFTTTSKSRQPSSREATTSVDSSSTCEQFPTTAGTIAS
jgi:hypothetical protein